MGMSNVMDATLIEVRVKGSSQDTHIGKGKSHIGKLKGNHAEVPGRHTRVKGHHT